MMILDNGLLFWATLYNHEKTVPKAFPTATDSSKPTIGIRKKPDPML